MQKSPVRLILADLSTHRPPKGAPRLRLATVSARAERAANDGDGPIPSVPPPAAAPMRAAA
ncbi:MAG: hypothetical protein KF819_08550 [Labilithrix sp.]|nr:hypothetical protein [Labilithrix sp.]